MQLRFHQSFPSRLVRKSSVTAPITHGTAPINEGNSAVWACMAWVPGRESSSFIAVAVFFDACFMLLALWVGVGPRTAGVYFICFLVSPRK